MNILLNYLSKTLLGPKAVNRLNLATLISNKTSRTRKITEAGGGSLLMELGRGVREFWGPRPLGWGKANGPLAGANCKNGSLLPLMFLAVFSCNFLHAADPIVPQVPPKLAKKMVNFNFENEDLITIINYLAGELKINVLLPMPPNNITAKATLRHQKKMSLHDAFVRLQTILDTAGYNILPHGKNTYMVVKTDQAENRDALPTYIGVAAQELPSSDVRIRYVYFFENIKIPTGGGGQAAEIKIMLEDMLKDPNHPGTGDVLFDSATNAMILTANSYSIKVAMQVISELDKTGFRELVEVVRLVHTSAPFVAKFLNDQLLAPTPQHGPQGAAVFPPNADHALFAKTVKIVADPRSNSLILLGRTQALDRLKDFIYKYIDVPLESGDSIIHVYDLQYLDAGIFADDLINIIKSPEIPGQAKGAASVEARQFQGVIIAAEKYAEAQKLVTKAGEAGAIAQGGNRLIIAAKKSDWIALKHLIDDLDKPQPQVSLDVLVVDVALADVHAITNQLRNPNQVVARNVNFQFNGDGTVGGNNGQILNTPPVNLNTDLLLVNPNPGNTPGANLATAQTPGTFILSFFDQYTNGIWWVMNILQTYANTRILSHPHITTVNQRQANVSVAETRLAAGPVKQNPDGSTVATQVNLTADLTVELLPRINLSNSINMQIAVKINNFLAGTNNNNTINTRTVITNATVGNGEVLVLGGLVQNNETSNGQEIPLLSSLPLVGWMFKGNTKEVTRNNLMVFIAPTVVKPRLSGGVTPFTADKFAVGEQLMASGELFNNLRDPVNRWYFASPRHSAKGLAAEYKADAFFSDEPLRDSIERKLIIPPAVNRERRSRRSKKEYNEQKVLPKQPEPAPHPVMAHDEYAAKRLKELLANETMPVLS